MELRIKQLIKRLAFLGYCTFEINKIIRHVTGSDELNLLTVSQGSAVIGCLEMYEKLGQTYLQNYSK